MTLARLGIHAGVGGGGVDLHTYTHKHKHKHTHTNTQTHRFGERESNKDEKDQESGLQSAFPCGPHMGPTWAGNWALLGLPN